MREVKKRIGSAKTVRKITKAMKLMAASKSRAAQVANLLSRPYSQHLTEMVSRLWQITNPRDHPLLKRNLSHKICHVILATDKGLCGGLLDRLENYLLKNGVFNSPQNTYFVLGKRGQNILIRHGARPTAVFEFGFKKTSLETIHPLVKLIRQGYLAEEFKEVIFYYNHFVSVLKQEPRSRPLLPVEIKVGKNTRAADTALYEPNADVVLEALLPRYLEMAVFQMVLENVASEHAARMVAMDQATNNAEEIIEDLTLSYNKIRQENITKELLEITSTMSAL